MYSAPGPKGGAAQLKAPSPLHLLSWHPARCPGCRHLPRSPSLWPSKEHTHSLGSEEVTAPWNQETGGRRGGGHGDVADGVELLGRPVVLGSEFGFSIETRSPGEGAGLPC